MPVEWLAVGFRHVDGLDKIRIDGESAGGEKIASNAFECHFLGRLAGIRATIATIGIGYRHQYNSVTSMKSKVVFKQ